MSSTLWARMTLITYKPASGMMTGLTPIPRRMPCSPGNDIHRLFGQIPDRYPLASIGEGITLQWLVVGTMVQYSSNMDKRHGAKSLAWWNIQRRLSSGFGNMATQKIGEVPMLGV